MTQTPIFSATDVQDVPWLIDEFVPFLAAVVDDVFAGYEDAVGESVVAHFDGSATMLMLPGTTSSRLIHQHDGMSARGKHERDFGQMHLQAQASQSGST